MKKKMPTMKNRHFGGGAKPENYVCISKPNNAVYCIDEERGIHEHAGGVYGFFHCDAELVKCWPKTIRKSAWNETMGVAK